MGYYTVHSLCSTSTAQDYDWMGSDGHVLYIIHLIHQVHSQSGVTHSRGSRRDGGRGAVVLWWTSGWGHIAWSWSTWSVRVCECKGV